MSSDNRSVSQTVCTISGMLAQNSLPLLAIGVSHFQVIILMVLLHGLFLLAGNNNYTSCSCIQQSLAFAAQAAHSAMQIKLKFR